MDEAYKKHIRGTLYTTLYALPLNLKGLILIPALTKSLDVGIYGTFVVIQTVISLITGISNSGLEASLSRFLPAKKGTTDGRRIFYSIFWTSLAANLCVFALFLAFASEISSALGVSSATTRLIGAIIALYSIFGIAVEYFRATERFGLFLLIAGGRAYLEVIAIALAAIALRSLDAMVGFMLFVTFLFAVGTVFRVLSEIGKPELPNFHIKPYLEYSLPLIPMTMADWVINLSDRFLIGLMLGSAAVGWYNPGYALGSMVLFAPTIFVTMLPPLIARLHDTGEMGTLDEIIRYTLKYFLIIAIPVFFGSLVLSRPLLTVLSNSEIADQSYFVTPIVVFGAIFFGCARVLLHVLQVKLQTQSIAKAWMTAALVNLVLNVLFLKLFGIVAAAISTAVAFAIAFLIIKNRTDKIHPVRFNGITLVRIALSSVCMSGVVSLVYLATSQNVLLNLGIGMISYAVFLFVFRVFEEREKKLIGFLLGKALQFAR